MGHQELVPRSWAVLARARRLPGAARGDGDGSCKESSALCFWEVPRAAFLSPGETWSSKKPAGMGNIDKRVTMVVTLTSNCSYSPVLVLVRLGDLKPSNKGQCLFLGQPKSCVLRIPTASPKWWVKEGEGGGGGGRRWKGGGEGHQRGTSCRSTLQQLTLPDLLHTPLPTVRVWALGGGFSHVCILEVNGRYIFCVSCSPFTAVSLLGWNAPFLSFSLSCSEISTPIPLQSSVTACFIFLLSALCFDPLIRGLGFYLEDICLRCLV